MERLPQRKRRVAEEDDSAPRSKARRTAEASAAAPALPPAVDLDEVVEAHEAPTVVYCTDVEQDKASGEFFVYAVSHDKAHTYLLRVTDFAPFYFARAPLSAANGAEPSPEQLAALAAAVAARHGGAVEVRFELVTKMPIMWYRAAADKGACSLLKVCSKGSTHERLQAALRRVAEDGEALESLGLKWPHYEVFEENVKPLNRFLATTDLCGGGWLSFTGGVSVPRGARVSRCNSELLVAHGALTSLTPDAQQLADPRYAASLAAKLAGGGPAAEAAAAGKLPPLTCCFVDVQLACAPSKGAIKGRHPSPRTPNADTDPVVLISCMLAPLPSGGVSLQPTSRIVFTWRGSRPDTDAAPGVELRSFAAEREMLAAWQTWLLEADPDVICVFRVCESFKVLATRSEKLKLPLQLGRHATQPITVKSAVQYNVNWVKSQQRMAATSNQEVFKATLGGRLVMDILRQVLTSHSLGTFTLGESVLALLGTTMEVLPPASIAAMHHNGEHGGAARLQRYSQRRAELVGCLMSKLDTYVEHVELARCCGLSIPIVLYQAQMVRTHSLLLRAARRAGFVLGGQLEGGGLTASPFLIHPIEQKTAKLYTDPVAVLDFASLYPSAIIAYNIDYSTLVHPSDVPGKPGAVLREDDVTRSPTGDVFVKPSLRVGHIPALLSALLSARAAARAALAQETDVPRRAVLEGRQRSLKLVANAMYGFLGANASPLRCIQLADSCLAFGAQACRKAISVLEASPELSGSKVIYSQTDSIFLHFCGKNDTEALHLSARAAQIASNAFPAPMTLKLERVMKPFLLLHVNRYCGAEISPDSGKLLIKGIKSAWRQAAPFLRSLLTRSLELALVDRDLPAAQEHAASEIHRLLSGGVDIGELVMSGGLWRVTGKDIAKAALAAEAGDAEVKGPHAALAVRLAARDPGRVRVLGERVPYVLLNGFKSQDDAAEDPVTAMNNKAAPNVSLYWQNKVLPPLQEVFTGLLGADTPALRELLTGAHTRVKAAAAPTGGIGGFFAPKARCLGCRQNVGGSPPPVCDSCKATPSRAQEALLRVLDDLNNAEAKLAAGDAACLRCHSGGLMQEILCTNGDCPILFARGKARADAAEARAAISRFSDW